jgi:hypothetical protein
MVKLSFKNRYIKLSTEKFGGPYALISRGIKKGIVQSIMKGSMPKIHEAYKVAKILGVSLETLLTGKAAGETWPLTIAESPAPYHLAGAGKVITDQEEEYIGKLLVILRRKDEGMKQTIMLNIDQFLRFSDAAIPRKKGVSG